MAITWAEVRREILILLDDDGDASPDDHDIAFAVDRRMARQRSRLFNRRKPLALFRESDEVSIVSTTTQINLTTTVGDNPGLGITASTFWKPFTFVVQEPEEDEASDYEFVDYRSWIRQLSAQIGNQRRVSTFTITPDNEILLVDYPESGITWTGKLWYYERPAEIVDGGTPEIDEEHIDAIILPVVVSFPNLFQGEERLALLAGYKAEAKEAEKLYFQDTGIAKKNYRMRPAQSRKRRRFGMWSDDYENV